MTDPHEERFISFLFIQQVRGSFRYKILIKGTIVCQYYSKAYKKSKLAHII